MRRGPGGNRCPGPSREQRFDTGGYDGPEMSSYATRTLSSWDDAGWRALLLQRFTHTEAVELLTLPASASHHFWLITSGTGSMSVRSTTHGWQHAPIRAGRLGRATPGVSTDIRYTSESPMSTLQVHLPGGTVDRVRAQFDLAPVAPEPVGEEPLGDELIASLMRSLAKAAEQKADPLYADSAAEFLAVHLATGGGRLTPRLPEREDPRVRKAVAMMRENVHRRLTLAELAGEVHLSSYHFLRVFKQATGRTPGRYLTRLRIAEAARLLDAGKPVAEVAALSGFSSPEHLSTAFLRETGMRPSQYRSR